MLDLDVNWIGHDSLGSIRISSVYSTYGLVCHHDRECIHVGKIKSFQGLYWPHVVWSFIRIHHIYSGL